MLVAWAVSIVTSDSPALQGLNENFLNIAREREFKVLSFAETHPTTIGPMIKSVVVPKQSAGKQVKKIWRSKRFGWLQGMS